MAFWHDNINPITMMVEMSSVSMKRHGESIQLSEGIDQRLYAHNRSCVNPLVLDKGLTTFRGDGKVELKEPYGREEVRYGPGKFWRKIIPRQR